MTYLLVGVPSNNRRFVHADHFIPDDTADSKSKKLETAALDTGNEFPHPHLKRAEVPVPDIPVGSTEMVSPIPVPPCGQSSPPEPPDISEQSPSKVSAPGPHPRCHAHLHLEFVDMEE